MLKDFTKEITEEWFYAALGLETEEECKLCGSPLMANDLGDKWCSGIKCSWANDEELIKFKQGIVDAIKENVMLEYKIIMISNDLDKFVDHVNYYLQNGWTLQGGVALQTLTNDSGEYYTSWYHQAMVREVNNKGDTMFRPEIVCLCGSTKFWREYQKWNLHFTLENKIVLSIGAATGTDDEHFGNLPKAEYDRIKTMLDELHKRKIDLADYVFVINVGGYIGESTRSEIEYAKKLGKRIEYLESV